MDNKKKQCGEVLYRVRYVLLFFMALSIYLFIFSVNSYATIDYETLKAGIDYVVENNNMTSFIGLYPAESDVLAQLSTYDNFIIETAYNNTVLDICYGYSFFKVNNTNNGSVGSTNTQDNYLRAYYFDGSSYWVHGNKYLKNINNGINNFAVSSVIYTDSTLTDILYNSNISLTPSSSIILTSTSNHKFGFNDKNQLIITSTGDINIHDYNYYVQRFIDNEWEYMTFSSNDYLYLSDYENPWYVFFPNLNYFPVGIYRYVAGNDAETPIYISNEFEITQSIVDNNGTATGTIDPNNGDVNVDVNIDTGKTVDDVKDYLGGQANFDNTTISQEDIENSLNIEQTVGPYDNFVLTFINGLIGSLTDVPSKDFTFKVHTWGNTYSFKTSDIIPQYGEQLHSFLRMMSIIAFGFVLVKWSTKLVEAINVGDVSKSLELVEEKYSDLL